MAKQKQTNKAKPTKQEKKKNPHAVALGKLGGSKGGRARAKALSPERRTEIAWKAAAIRWYKRKKVREAAEKKAIKQAATRKAAARKAASKKATAKSKKVAKKSVTKKAATNKKPIKIKAVRKKGWGASSPESRAKAAAKRAIQRAAKRSSNDKKQGVGEAKR